MTNRIHNAEFLVKAEPRVAFSIDENSTPEDFVEAVTVCAYVAVGGIRKATRDEVDFCEATGPALLEEANLRFGPGTSARIAQSIAAGVKLTKKLVAEYGSPRAVKAAIEDGRIDIDAEVVKDLTQNQGGPFAGLDAGLMADLDDEVL